jgi:hypothetical protein
MVTFIVIADFLGSQILEGNFSEMHIRSAIIPQKLLFRTQIGRLLNNCVCAQNDVPARPTFSLLKNSAPTPWIN